MVIYSFTEQLTYASLNIKRLLIGFLQMKLVSLQMELYPTRIYVMYMSYPLYINEGYINLMENHLKIKTVNLQSYLEDELLDSTVQNLAMYTETLQQCRAPRIQTNE
jgi:hypothetical protein